jgi:hypothetical protein
LWEEEEAGELCGGRGDEGIPKPKEEEQIRLETEPQFYCFFSLPSKSTAPPVFRHKQLPVFPNIKP